MKQAIDRRTGEHVCMNVVDLGVYSDEKLIRLKDEVEFLRILPNHSTILTFIEFKDQAFEL